MRKIDNLINIFWSILNISTWFWYKINLPLIGSGGVFVWRIGLFLNSTYYTKLNTIL